MGARGYGTIDLVFAVLYAYLGFFVAPSRSLPFQLAFGVVAGLLALAGAGLLAFGERARIVGIIACFALLAFTLGVFVLLAASAGVLLGVYGAIGRGIGFISLAAAALIVEMFGFLPLFQLRFHLRRDHSPR